MKLKTVPRDFRVREELVFPRVDGGEYFVHLLRKEKLDTHQALARVAKLAGVPRDALAFAGLKDRQGRTEQWISIRGRRLDHRERGLSVSFVARSDRPINSRMSRGNSFEIVLRDLGQDELLRLRANAAGVVQDGLPNYFDDQRFGCLAHGQGFLMRAVLRGDYETALRQLLAQPSEQARGGDVKLKRLLATHWGDWDVCARIARGPFYGRVLQHLRAQPRDFRGALLLVPTRTKLIHAYAYQSWLWNRAIDGMLRGVLRRGAMLDTLSGRLLAWERPAPALIRRLEQLDAPLFAPDGEDGDAEYERALVAVLREQGFARRFAVPPMAGLQLRAEPRAVVVRPTGFELSETLADEFEPGRRKVVVRFGLPRGSYATLVIKRLVAGTAVARSGGRRRSGPPPADRQARSREA